MNFSEAINIANIIYINFKLLSQLIKIINFYTTNTFLLVF